MTDTADFLPAGQLRRLGSLCYDFILLAALVVVAGGVFQPLFSFYGKLPWLNLLYQVYLLAVVFGYFAYCWIRSGQTLAMKTWRTRVVDRKGRPLQPLHALLRFLLCWPSIGLFGIGLLWALFDRDRQFLHDRLAGTRLAIAN